MLFSQLLLQPKGDFHQHTHRYINESSRVSTSLSIIAMATAKDSLSPDERVRRPSFQAYIPANPSRLGQAWNADDTSTERDPSPQSPSSNSTKSHRSIAGLSATSDRSDELSATRTTYPPVGTAQGQGQIRETPRRFPAAIQIPHPAIQVPRPAIQPFHTQLDHPAIQIPRPAIQPFHAQLNHPDIQLPHPTVPLPNPAVQALHQATQLPLSQVDSPLPEGSWVNNMGQVYPPTPPGFEEDDRGQARLCNLPLDMIPSSYAPLSVDPNPPHRLIQVFGPPPPHVPGPMLGDHPGPDFPRPPLGSQMPPGPPFGHHLGPAPPGLPMGSPILTGPPLGHHPGPAPPGPPFRHHPGLDFPHPPMGPHVPPGPPLGPHLGPALLGPPAGPHMPPVPTLGHHQGPNVPSLPEGSRMLTGPHLGHHPVNTLPGLPVSSHELTPTANYMPQLSHSVSFDPSRSPTQDRAPNKTPPNAESQGDDTSPKEFALNPTSPAWTPGNNV